MKRKSPFLLIPALLLTFGVATKLSPVGVEAQPIADEKAESCNEAAAHGFAACLDRATDETQRQQCREYFECLRDVCAAIRKGVEQQVCMQPF